MNRTFYTIRATPWPALAIATVLSALLVFARAGDTNVFAVQAAALLLAGAAGFALDDAAFELFAASPTSLLRRRASRLGVMVPPTVLFWGTLTAVAGTESVEETLTVIAMFAGLLGLSFGVGGIVGRRTDGRGGPFVAPIILFAIIVSSTFPDRRRPLPTGDIPGGWSAIQLRWSLAAILGTVAFVFSSRDTFSRPSSVVPRKRNRRLP